MVNDIALPQCELRSSQGLLGLVTIEDIAQADSAYVPDVSSQDHDRVHDHQTPVTLPWTCPFLLREEALPSAQGRLRR